VIRVALGAASGFLLGVLLVVALSNDDNTTRTVNRTITVISPTLTNGGTVIVTTAVPDLVGERLDIASERLLRAGFVADVEGGGIFGIVDEAGWEVVEQDPPPGGQLEQGSTIHLLVDRP
jgi:beta-lactam-binding protein with PASTA domain